MYSILIVDDEPNLRQSLSLVLERSGYQVTSASCGAEALQCLEAEEFHLAFLDIMMPDMDGITLLTKVRSKHPSMPIFLLTAYATLDTAVQAIRFGANDYLLKPIDPGVILQRVREMLQNQSILQQRRVITSQLHQLMDELHRMDNSTAPGQDSSAPTASSTYSRFLQRGAFTLDLHTRTLQLEGRTIQLPTSTFNFLVSLLRHSPEPVPYEILIRESQGYDLSRAEARELARGQVHELRKVLETDLRHPRYVVTIRDVGYRLVTSEPYGKLAISN